ncbi:MAG TPA: extracellular solute-binding protein [Abditibacteriaceae bacterium]|jgi:ABC-type glycerol-3-phosphate transport system substrate-binding protein
MQRFKIVVSTILALAALAVLLFGPRPGATRPKDRVVVTYWEKWTNKEADQMKQIVNDFNNTVGKEKNIFVEYLSMSSINQKTLVSTAAGVPPDVAGVWDAQVPQFAAVDALEPLDELAAAKGITKGYYKPVYWEGCSYNGRLWAMVSTPAAVALHYNKRIFKENAAKLKAAGLDPDRAPQTLDELDRYAAVIDKKDKQGSLEMTGYLPMEPGWWLSQTAYWFGTDIFDPKTQKFTLTDPKVVRAYEWIRSYSVKLGKESMSEFRGSFGTFDSPNNPFMVGKLAMVQQGPWMSNYIENNRPKLNRVVTNDKKMELAWPAEKRRTNYEWAAAPFPSAVPGMKDVAHCPFDVLVIPRGARHPKEAFEFIAYVNSQGPMEKLCMLHCKNSPLAKVSRNFLQNHPNPYIEVFERLASSPNARTITSLGIWPEVNDELNNVAQRVYLLEARPADALRDAQNRLQEKYDRYQALQIARSKS